MLPTRLVVASHEWVESKHTRAFRQAMDVEHAPRLWAETERTTNLREASSFESEGAGKSASSQPQWNNGQTWRKKSSSQQSTGSSWGGQNISAWQQGWQDKTPSWDSWAQWWGSWW